MDGSERRKFKRLEVNYDITFSAVGSMTENKFGNTLNAGSGGLFFETEDNTLEPGNMLKINLTIPPKSGLLEYGGKVGGLARVLRIDKIFNPKIADNLSSDKYGVAVEFCRPLRLNVQGLF